MATLRFALLGSPDRAAAAASVIASAIERHPAEDGCERVAVEPMFLPSYSALYDAMDREICGAAWAPPWVALDLARCAAAFPIAAAVREDRTTYYSVLLAGQHGPSSIAALAGTTVGWVAPESAAGHLVPRLHLASLGLDPYHLFAREVFYGTHAAAHAAIEHAQVDVIATYASLARFEQRLVPPNLRTPYRVVAASGPIPSDVIVGSPNLPPALSRRIAAALCSMDESQLDRVAERSRVQRFVRANVAHLEPLRGLATRSTEAVLRNVSGVSRRPSAVAMPN